MARDVQARICGGPGWATTQAYPASATRGVDGPGTGAQVDKDRKRPDLAGQALIFYFSHVRRFRRTNLPDPRNLSLATRHSPPPTYRPFSCGQWQSTPGPLVCLLVGPQPQCLCVSDFRFPGIRPRSWVWCPRNSCTEASQRTTGSLESWRGRRSIAGCSLRSCQGIRARCHEGIKRAAQEAISVGGDSHNSLRPFKTTSRVLPSWPRTPIQRGRPKNEESTSRPITAKAKTRFWLDPAAGEAAEPDGEGQSPEVVADQHHIGYLQGDVGAGRAHGDPDVGGGQRRGVVHAVADHGEEVAGVHQSLQFDHLLVGQEAGPNIVRADPFGHGLCDALVVSRQDQDLGDSRLLQGRQRGGGIRRGWSDTAITPPAGGASPSEDDQCRLACLADCAGRRRRRRGVGSCRAIQRGLPDRCRPRDRRRGRGPPDRCASRIRETSNRAEPRRIASAMTASPR